MSRLKLSPKSNMFGFTLIEVMIAIVITGIVSTIIYTFFITSFNQYFALESDGLVFGDLAEQSQRVASVLRGATDITAATANDLTVTTYFSPRDAYVSQVRYYIQTSGSVSQLLADVTPYSANPPAGTLQIANKKTYTIISSYFVQTGVNLFSYYDSAGTLFTLPIADLHTIKNIQITLSSPTKSPSVSSDTINVQVSLRNRKTNL